MSGPRVALCLPGGGATGAMYQIGALAALEHAVAGLNVAALDLYVAASSGASVAAALAGGRPVQRLYRAFLDPSDRYFPLERKHLLRADVSEWQRALRTAFTALRHGAASLASRRGPLTPAELWAQLDRFNDSLPAGAFSLELYERFLEDFFVRRGIPRRFGELARPLRVLAHDLDSGQEVVFGEPGHPETTIARACAATLAVPPFFSPVRVGDRHYIDAMAAQLSVIDVAARHGAEVVVVVNPMVPVDVDRVPTGHGRRASLRDKGMFWVANQAIRIGMHQALRDTVERVKARGVAVALLEPDPSDGLLFLHSPMSFSARREILEVAYRSTRGRVLRWLRGNEAAVARAGWRARGEGSLPPPPPESAG